MHSKEVIERLIARFGGTEAACATSLKFSQPTLNAWRRLKHGISPKAAMRIERLTDGEFKATELCPDLAEFADAS